MNFHLQVMAQFDIAKKTEEMVELRKEGKIDEYLKQASTLKDTIAKRKNWEKVDALVRDIFKAEPILKKSNYTSYRKLLIGLAYYQQNKLGKYQNALTTYEKAHYYLQFNMDTDTSAWYCENVIGTIYTRYGDYEKALKYFDITKNQLMKNKKDKQLSRLHNNNGIVYHSQGKLSKAKLEFQKGMELSKNISYDLGYINSLDGYIETRISMDDDVHKDLTLMTKVLPKIRNEKSYYYLESRYFYLVAENAITKKNYKHAITSYQTALISLRKYFENEYRREYAKIYFKIADTYIKNNELDKSEAQVELGLKNLVPYKKSEFIVNNDLYNENTFIELYNTKSKIDSILFHKTKDKKYLISAISHTEKAIYVSEMLRNIYLVEPSKLLSISQHKKMVNRGIEMAYEHYKNSSKEKSAINKLANFFLQSKSLLLNERQIQHQKLYKMSHADRATIYELKRELLQVYEDRYSSKKAENETKKIVDLNEKINTIQAKYKYYNYRLLEGNFIEFVFTDSNLYAYIKINQKEEIKRLSSLLDFNKKFESVKETLLNPENLKESALEDLYNLLFHDLDLPNQMTFIPDGKLSFIPFESLKHDGKYLIEKCKIKYSYTRYLNENKVENTNKTDLEIIVPQYKEQQVSKTRGSLYHLPNAMIEANAINEVISGNISSSINMKEFFKKIFSSKIFHFTGHAVNTLDGSFLALGLPNNAMLGNEEILSQHYENELVVLSACESGIGQEVYGDGMRSISRCFMEGGAKSVLHSLWNIDDKFTSSFMSDFYELLKNGGEKDDALQKLKINSIQQKNEYSHPYYWSALVVVGDTSALSINSQGSIFFFLICAFSLGLIFIIYKKFKK